MYIIPCGVLLDLKGLTSSSPLSFWRLELRHPSTIMCNCFTSYYCTCIPQLALNSVRRYGSNVIASPTDNINPTSVRSTIISILCVSLLFRYSIESNRSLSSSQIQQLKQLYSIPARCPRKVQPYQTHDHKKLY